MARIQLKLFGGFHAAHADGAEISLSARKGEALVAYLALSQIQRQTRERLAALLWATGSKSRRGTASVKLFWRFEKHWRTKTRRL